MNNTAVIAAVVGALLFGVFGWLVFGELIWAIPFALMGAILGYMVPAMSGGRNRGGGPGAGR